MVAGDCKEKARRLLRRVSGRRIFFRHANEKAAHGRSRTCRFKLKLHVDQFKRSGAGAALARQNWEPPAPITSIISPEEGIKKLAAASETVAVLLPWELRSSRELPASSGQKAPRRLGARVALSTDYKPRNVPQPQPSPYDDDRLQPEVKMSIAEAICRCHLQCSPRCLASKSTWDPSSWANPFRTCQLKAESYEVLPYCFGELD